MEGGAVFTQRVNYRARDIRVDWMGWEPFGNRTESAPLRGLVPGDSLEVVAEVWMREGDPARLEHARCWKDDLCPCCGRPHPECPTAHPCFGHCGKLTTAYQSVSCGYCDFCAADSGWRSISEVL